MSEQDQLGLQFGPPPRRVWTVGELVVAVRAQLERQYADVYVEGEISNFRAADSGHLYFTLKEGAAQVRAVMFRSQARLLRFRPENGLQVMARGRVTVYEARGELQISVEHLEPQGAGALQIAFEQLKAKLGAEGLFAAERKKALPLLPRRIGVVTSASGAALQDILQVLGRRHDSVAVLICPAQVQGEAAAAEVSAGVRYFNSTHAVDVIIVARGGGSLEDLAAFNDEGLARTVAASEIPVISAVGHEVDFTICDFVADLRAPTPSAAAEMVVRSQRELLEQVQAIHQRLTRGVRYQLLMARQALTQLAQHGAFARTRSLIGRRQQRVDEAVFRLAQAQREILTDCRRRLEAASARLRHRELGRQMAASKQVLQAREQALAAAADRLLMGWRSRWARSSAQLEALSPLNILERGYALVFDQSGRLVKDAGRLRPGEPITARLARGSVEARVSETKP